MSFGRRVVRAELAEHRGSSYSEDARQHVQKNLVGKPGYGITGVRDGSYVKDTKDNIFCLAPEGWQPWSPRPSYAVSFSLCPCLFVRVMNLLLETPLLGMNLRCRLNLVVLSL